MPSSSGRETRGVRRATYLVILGLFTLRWGPFGRRSRVVTDLERRNAELAAELAEARATSDRTFSGVNDVFWTVEILDGEEMTITYLSADASGVVGTDIHAGLDAIALREGLSHPDDAPANSAFTAAMLAGVPAEVEERLVGLDGVTRWTWSRGTPRKEGGRLFFDGITTNITERHDLAQQREALLERERAQVAMLEEMHRSRDDFIALAGHELRTPLTVIQGYAEHLLEDPSMGTEQRTQLEIVVRRSRSMSDLIDDLFDLAKLDIPLPSIAFAPVALDDLVEESAQAHEEMARQRDITIQISTDPAEVIGDRARLLRMCDNLMDNAVKFSSPEGRITVTVSTEGGDAVLVVADEGIGIPPSDLPHVFERLFRADNVIGGRYPGTGLGLSITLATAQAYGGSATVESPPGSGAIFTIRLPLHDGDDS